MNVSWYRNPGIELRAIKDGPKLLGQNGHREGGHSDFQDGYDEGAEDGHQKVES